MVYKCFECGHLFESGEERRVIEDHGEEYLACPCCGGAYEATVQCKSCEGNFFENVLYNGWCINCLGEKMTINNMRQYLKDSNIEADFYLEEFYESNVTYATESLIKLARDGFMSALRADELNHYGERGFESQYIEMMRKFIVDNGFGLYDFAEWLNKREEKK